MNQPSFFPDLGLVRHVWSKDEMIVTVDTDQSRILRNISKLYNAGFPFECDVTFSKGVFYKHLPEPRLKFDLYPQVEGVEQASADNLPLPDTSLTSLVFDPPFKASNSNVKGIIEQRFTAFKSVPELWSFYGRALQEFMRVLHPRGIVVFKCQDTVSSGINWMTHFQVEKMAEEVGFGTLDLFILQAKSTIWSPNMAHQVHARKSHSFFYVFQKPKGRP